MKSFPAQALAHRIGRCSGITLMEVLISIGILSVGLTAVVALIPAGGAEARRAIVEDRKANAGLAGLHDVVTRGILDTTKWSAVPAKPYRIIVDPIGSDSVAGLTSVSFSGMTGQLIADEAFRSQDDLYYSLENSGEDLPPEPLYFNGNAKRLSEGNFSYLFTLVPTPATTASQFQNYLLSAVVFYRRETPVQEFDTVTNVGERSVQFTCGLSVEDFRSLFRKDGVVLLYDDGSTSTKQHVWRRVVFASLNTANNDAELMFDRTISVIAADTTLYAFNGAVAAAERVVRLEEQSPWMQ